jgi:hypothetical protein
MLLISKEELSYTCQILLMFFLRQSDTSQSFPVWLLPYRVKVGSTAEVVLCSRCLNFFHQLVKKQKKKFIYSNKFFHNFHLSECSFTCPRLWASGLA